MRRFIFVFVGVFSILVFTNCTGPDGGAYQKYWWAGSLQRIYDTNPSTPSTIYNDTYFSTRSGKYYMEYKAWNGSEWYMHYKITTNEGKLFNIAGDDSWFTIGLYSTGPVLYKRDLAKNIGTSDALKENVEPSVLINTKDTKISTGKLLSEIIGTDKKVNSNGSIEIEYGKILED